MSTLFTAAALLLSACGKLNIGEFASYVSTFEAEAAARGQELHVDNLVIKLDSSLPNTIRAQCQERPFATPTIAVNQTIWDKSSDEDKEALLMHELGHCVLHRDHKKGDFPDGTAISLMRAVSPYGKSYEAHRQYYLDELFDNND
ncbi:MAG: hypothetical protein HYR96_01600 [Deltaproteobacteria bacterium]|nr:hypothetical protein [Deltaproteobacteria bacterium]MBI3294410.1 hypothetical protein [Deltaproteobacteria bacterium]